MAVEHGTVIVADRHHQMLCGVHALLGVVFDAVVMVADDRSLLEAVERMRPELVIIDLSLPSSGGDLNVAHRLAAARPDLRVIVLSVHDEPAAVRQTLAAGAAGFVLKRSAATDLMPAVQEVLQGRAYVSPAARVQPTPTALSSSSSSSSSTSPSESSPAEAPTPPAVAAVSVPPVVTAPPAPPLPLS